MIKFGTGGWRAVIGDDFTRENVQLVANGILKTTVATLSNLSAVKNTAKYDYIVGIDDGIKIRGKILENVPLKNLTTYKLSGIASKVIIPSNIDELKNLINYIKENKIPCPKCGKTNFTDIRQFNLMFATQRGVTNDSKNTIYLRPENAQGEYESRYIYDKCFKPKFDKGVSKLLDKFYENPESLTNSEKLSLKFILGQGFSSQTVSFLKPRVLLTKFKDELNKLGVNYNLSDFDGKTDSEMIKFITEKVAPTLDFSNNYVNIK